MIFFRDTRLTLLAAMTLVLSAGFSAARAQAPEPPKQTPPAVTTPPDTPAPAASTPAPAAPAASSPAAETKPPETAPATPVPPKSADTPAPAPSTPPAAAQAPATPPADQKVQAADPFGEEVALTGRKVVTLKGKGDWDSAFETITSSLKALAMLLDKQGIKPAAPFLIVYTSTDDAGFTFQAQIPVDQDPKNLSKDMSIGTSPEGKTLKFVHHGSYDNMDNTYEAITNYLDDKKLEAKDTFIEEYVTDPLKTSEDKLVINVFVPLK
ncbi:MAG: GyrI-like domain-containing protein [Xanthobacteraceae bacterium]|nr:GyrI-like domain-containing protein [Xanthobacteraceae bacterium]